MAMSTLTASMDAMDREVLDHYKEGVGVRTIGLRTGLEVTDVQRIVQELTGNDRTKAGALVSAYDQQNGAPAASSPATPPAPASPATPAPVKARKTRTPRQPAEAPQDAPAAPTVVPVDLSEPLPADVPVTPISTATDDQPTDTTPDADAEPELVTRHDGDQDNVDDDWAALDRAMSPLLEQALSDQAEPAPVDAEQVALAGPTDPLPNVRSFEDLMAAVQGVRDPELSALATQIGALVDQLHARYAQARKSREVRAEAVRLRRELTRTLAMLARLEGTAPADTAPAPAEA